MSRPLRPRRLRLGAMRQHFTRNGDPKRAWPDKEAAQTAGNQHHKYPYLCGTCGQWHIGGSK